MFAYCLNNPVTFSDETGAIALELTASTLIGFSALLVCSAQCAYYVTNIIWEATEWIGSVWRDPLLPMQILDNEGLTASIDTASEHTKNKSERNRNKHEEGNSRRQRDQGGEKKKQKKGWNTNPNKRRAKNYAEDHYMYY